MMQDLAGGLAGRLWALLVAALVFLATAQMLSGPPAIVLASAAVVLILMACVLDLIARGRAGAADPTFADPSACVICDIDGNVLGLNAEARRIFDTSSGAGQPDTDADTEPGSEPDSEPDQAKPMTIGALLDGSIPNRAAVTFRLRQRVMARGSGQEDVLFQGHEARLSTRRLPHDRLLWRLDCPAASQTPPASFGPDDADDGAAQTGAPQVAPDGWDRLDSLNIAFVKVRPDGQVVRFNARAARLLGCSITASDLWFHDLVEGLGRPVGDWLEGTVNGSGAARAEVVRARRPEQDMYLQVSLVRVIEDDEVFVAAVLNDATELKTLEAQFVQSQKMQAIGQLAGGVAHDFNNLLTAISGHCDLLLLRHDIGDPDYGDLQQIAQNANRAASLVGQLLAFSRKQNLRPQVLDLRETLADLTHLLNRLVGEKMTLSLSHDPDLRPIRADRRQLEQVLMNLVVNARDAMRDTGGEIRIATASLTLSEPEERDRAKIPAGDYVRVTVTDTGSGIPGDKLQKIFEPFYTTKKTREGTGLGLSTAYGIIKQTGGFIFADSVVGSGTTFTIYLPAASPDEAQRAAAAQTPAQRPPAMPPAGDGVVLLVEDEAPVRAFASHALRLRGYTVLEAANAEEALFMLEDDALHVDLFVSDVIMPGMDGPTWVRQALIKRPKVGTVFVSGYAEESFADEQARIPNCVFLPKPFSLAELTRTVSEQLS